MACKTPEEVAAEWHISRLKLIRFCHKHHVPLLDCNGTIMFDAIAIKALEDACRRQQRLLMTAR